MKMCKIDCAPVSHDVRNAPAEKEGSTQSVVAPTQATYTQSKAAHIPMRRLTGSIHKMDVMPALALPPRQFEDMNLFAAGMGVAAFADADDPHVNRSSSRPIRRTSTRGQR